MKEKIKDLAFRKTETKTENKVACGDCYHYDERKRYCELKMIKNLNPHTEGCRKWEFNPTHA